MLHILETSFNNNKNLKLLCKKEYTDRRVKSYCIYIYVRQINSATSVELWERSMS